MSQFDPTAAYNHFQQARLDGIAWPFQNQLTLTLSSHGVANRLELHFETVQDAGAVEHALTGMVGQQVAMIRVAPNYQALPDMIAIAVQFASIPQPIIIQSQHVTVRQPIDSIDTASTLASVADGQSVLSWLEQEIPKIMTTDWTTRNESLEALIKQVSEQVEQLSAFDKQAILEHLQHWEAIKAIGDMKILPDDETLRALGDIIETISGLLGD